MNMNKSMIVGLCATIGSAWLQAESLTFNFTTTPTSAVSFTPTVSSLPVSVIGQQFSGTLSIGSVVSSIPGTSVCNQPCSLSFTTGLATSDTTLFGAGATGYIYSFAAGSSSLSAQTGVGGSVNNPTPPGDAGSVPNSTDATLLTGSLGTTGISGIQNGSDPFSMAFSAPVSVSTSPNLLSLLAAFGLTGNFPLSGLLSFNIDLTTAPDPTYGSFSGTVAGGSLTLNVANVIPEPSSFLLIGLGLVCVAFIGRKRLLAHRL
jgi:hypothetical protein